MAGPEFFVDTHCHLDDPAYDGAAAAVLARAAAAGVTACMTIGTDVATSRRAAALAQQFPQVCATVGIHPHEAAQWTAEAEAVLEDLARQPNVVAIGEVGLDYYRDLAPRDIQQAAFRRALQLASRHRLPVVIHCREAWADLFAILRDMGSPPLRGVLHCFTGRAAELATALAWGFTISFAGNLTFKNADPLRAVARQAPLEHVVLETDAPYLAPQPHRGQRNEPAYLVETAKVFAALKQVPVEEVARITTANARALFQMDAHHVA